MGIWEGSGSGSYPTIETFDYVETLEIRATPKPFLTHQQRTMHAETGLPMHVETGYWRAPVAGRVELVLAHPTGITEVCVGSNLLDVLHVRSTGVQCTATAKPVESIERWYELDGDTMRYRISMAAVGLHHQHHLAGVLHRVG